MFPWKNLYSCKPTLPTSPLQCVYIYTLGKPGAPSCLKAGLNLVRLLSLPSREGAGKEPGRFLQTFLLVAVTPLNWRLKFIKYLLLWRTFPGTRFRTCGIYRKCWPKTLLPNNQPTCAMCQAVSSRKASGRGFSPAWFHVTQAARGICMTRQLKPSPAIRCWNSTRGQNGSKICCHSMSALLEDLCSGTADYSKGAQTIFEKNTNYL